MGTAGLRNHTFTQKHPPNPGPGRETSMGFGDGWCFLLCHHSADENKHKWTSEDPTPCVAQCARMSPTFFLFLVEALGPLVISGMCKVGGSSSGCAHCCLLPGRGHLLTSLGWPSSHGKLPPSGDTLESDVLCYNGYFFYPDNKVSLPKLGVRLLHLGGTPWSPCALPRVKQITNQTSMGWCWYCPEKGGHRYFSFSRQVSVMLQTRLVC